MARQNKPTEERSLNKRDVLYALAIIIGLSVAPIVASYTLLWQK